MLVQIKSNKCKAVVRAETASSTAMAMTAAIAALTAADTTRAMMMS